MWERAASGLARACEAQRDGDGLVRCLAHAWGVAAAVAEDVRVRAALPAVSRRRVCGCVVRAYQDLVS